LGSFQSVLAYTCIFRVHTKLGINNSSNGRVAETLK
jgi:hypothetical protein